MNQFLTSDIRTRIHHGNTYNPCDARGHDAARPLACVQEIWKESLKRLSEHKTYSEQGTKLDFAHPLDL